MPKVLTAAERDALPADAFAYPDLRQVPLHDAHHVVMARASVGKVKGATSEEHAAAFNRLLAAAHQHAVELPDSELRIEAMALDVPDTPGHPNKSPFRGVLVKLGTPSDLAPHGTGGRKIIMTHSAAEAALPTLIGMAVDCNDRLNDHDSQKKIGLITEAVIEGDDLVIAGFFYASDFPGEVSQIQANKSAMGFSFEAHITSVEDRSADPRVITGCVFTGAAVLLKNRAAYHSTSLAASAEGENMDLAEILAQLKELATSVSTLSGEIKEIKASGNVNASGAMMERVRPHVEACNATAAAMEAAGIGSHPSRGHAAVLRHVAAHMSGEAALGRIPHVYAGLPGYYEASGDGKTNASAEDPAVKALDEKIGKISASVESLTTLVKDLSNKSVSASAAPGRKTIPPHVTALLERGNVKVDDNGTVSAAAVDRALEGLQLDPQKRLEVKIALRNAGALAA